MKENKNEQVEVISQLDELFLPPSNHLMMGRFMRDEAARCDSHCKSPGGCMVIE